MSPGRFFLEVSMHLGKRWPRQWINFVTMVENYPAPGPTRKGRLDCYLLGNIGTVANLWNGLHVISDVAQRAADPTSTIYSFQHPTDALALITVTTKLIEKDPLPMGGSMYWEKLLYESYYNGVLIADTVRLSPTHRVWITPLTDTITANPWDHRYDLPKWTQFQCIFGAADWDEQPEYHPYRH